MGLITTKIYNRNLVLQGTYTTALDAGSDAEMDAPGDGYFVLHAKDTPLRDAFFENWIAVCTVPALIGSETLQLCCIAMHEMRDNGNHTLRVTGPDLMDELKFDNLWYDIVSDGAGGATNTVVSDLLAKASKSWAWSTFGTGTVPSGYVVGSGQSIADALFAVLKKTGYRFAMPQDSNPQRNLHVFYQHVVGSAIWDFGAVTLSQPADPSTVAGDPAQAVIIGNPGIREERRNADAVTRVRPYGGGAGDNRLTITDSTLVDPTGITSNKVLNEIVHTALETRPQGHPVIEKIKQFPDIKPEDDSATAKATAATELHEQAIQWILERTGEEKTFYIVEDTIIHVNIIPGQLVRVIYQYKSPRDNTGAEIETTLIDLNDDLVVYEIKHWFDKGVRHTRLKLGSAGAIAQYTGDDIILSKVKELDAAIRNLNAESASGEPDPDNSKHLAAYGLVSSFNVAALPNHRVFAQGTGIIITDAGPTGNLTFSVDSAAIPGMVHDPVTLTATLDANLLWLTNQEIGLDTQAQALVFASPKAASGKPSFRQLDHDELGNVGVNDHHSQSHVLATISALGPDHTVSGLTTGMVLRATGATTARFQVLAHSDLSGVGVNDHHNQVHDVVGSDHTIVASALQIVGATATNTLGLITPSSDPGTASAILKTDSNGHLTLDQLTVDTKLFVNESVNANMTIGITINQGANDDELFALKSSDVAHDVTDETETDTFGYIKKHLVANGGLRIGGVSESNAGVAIRGVVTVGDTAKDATAQGAVLVRGLKKSGTAAGNMGSNENVLVVRAGTGNTTVFIVDAEGDLWRDGTANTFDDYVDWQLVRAFDLATAPNVIENEFDRFLQYGRSDLIATGILSEGGFYSMTRLQKLHNGAIGQLGREQMLHDERIARLEALNGIR